ncbi:hypothetical protein [Roseovarius sp. 2305UL8-3]|uniref:hypothetical protein n=1 Tax=Roseovarius conchicola TaxID=3121636 RepID=UPI003529963F
MLKIIGKRTYLLFAFLAVVFGATPRLAEAQSYPIDCAILLCLSGGWPASEPCTRARAEFIRRITPWPVEPPLQIWRCPMGASYDRGGNGEFENWVEDVTLARAHNPLPHLRSDALIQSSHQPYSGVQRLGQSGPGRLLKGLVLRLVQDRADIDISGAEFDFVRSIRVFDIRIASQRLAGENDECRRFALVYLGTYGDQGEFSWRLSSPLTVPAAHIGLEGWGDECPVISNRSVFVDWRDFEGNYGFERVDY